jgi:phenylalanyl-tRNA synthetase alpha chain
VDDVAQLEKEALGEIEAAQDHAQVEALRVKYMGKKGPVSALMQRMGKLSQEEKKAFGARVNELKQKLEERLAAARTAADEREMERKLHGPKLDVTLPGRSRPGGHRHPVTQAMQDIIEIFARLGFHVADGPEIEWDLYNFEKLGFPPDHPARDMQDTFFVDATPGPKQRLLRTHTSPVQIRAMLSQKPPVRIICPGKVYRSDSDITHTPMFHQVECLHVEKGISMAHLRGTLDAFVKAFFGPQIETRLRPSYFPFTEPSAEVDISHPLCGGRGCKICKGTGWLEVLGAGMVNPDVLAGVGYDPEEITGYAFGAGIDRLAMLRHGIDDLRSLFENDVRFLEQL